MSVRRSAGFLLAAAALAAPVRADKLDKDSKKWLEEVRAIILPDEVKTYTTDLKDRGERSEFEKIFWARRDPDLSTPDNEYQKDFLARKADADKRFKVAGKLGSATDCGRLLILLGEPDSIKQDSSGEARGLRVPELWTYKSRPGMSFQGGEARIALDAECALANAAAGAELDRVASGLILNPGLSYKVQAGRITRLADLLPKPSPAQDLLKSPRQDFAVAGQLGFLRAEGATAVLGLVKADAAGVTVEDAGGQKSAQVTVAAQVVNEEGKPVTGDERKVTARVGQDGAVLASYRLFLKPGKYTLTAGLLDEKTGKGGALSQPVDVPDLNGADLSAGSLFVVKDIVEGATSDPQDALDAFVLGNVRLVPSFGNAFARSESAHFFYNVNGGAADPATGKPNLSVGLMLLKGTKTVARAPDQPFDAPHVISSVGPVELKYEAGVYTAKLKVHDNVSQAEMTQEQSFEIK